MVGGKNQEANGPDSFIVNAVRCCIKFLRLFTIGRWLPSSWAFVDSYVVTWTVISVLLYTLLQTNMGSLSFYVFLISCSLGILRVNEIVIFHAGELFREDLYRIRSPQRSLILVLINYMEIVIWFAIFYSAYQLGDLLKAEKPAPIVILRESLALMLSNSSGGFRLNGNLFPLITVTIQSVVGLFMILVVVTRFVSLLPRLDSYGSKDG